MKFFVSKRNVGLRPLVCSASFIDVDKLYIFDLVTLDNYYVSKEYNETYPSRMFEQVFQDVK